MIFNKRKRVCGIVVSQMINKAVYKATSTYQWISDGDTGEKDYSGKIEKAQQQFGGLYGLILMIVLSIAAMSIITIGAKYMLKKNANERRELHTQLLVVLIALIIIFGIGIVIGLGYSIGKKIV